jgi:transglutaminase-like putative cysteine protease
MSAESSTSRSKTRGFGRKHAFVLVVAVVVAILLIRLGNNAPVLHTAPTSHPVKLSIRRTIVVVPASGTSRYRVRFVRFPELPGQRILSETFSEGTHERGSITGGNWIGWDIASPTGPMEFFLETRLEVDNAGLSGSPRTPRETEVPYEFLGPDTFRQTDDPAIRALAAPGTITDTLAILRAHWETIGSTLRYTGWERLDRGAAFAVRTGGGDCSEFADLFTTLARVRGIPARSVNGWTLSGGPTQRHAWTEVWLPSRGWTAFDPTWGATGHTRFETVSTARAVVGWTLSGPEGVHQPFESWRWWGDSPRFESRDSMVRIE